MYNQTFVLAVCSAAHMISDRILLTPLILKTESLVNAAQSWENCHKMHFESVELVLISNVLFFKN